MRRSFQQRKSIASEWAKLVVGGIAGVIFGVGLLWFGLGSDPFQLFSPGSMFGPDGTSAQRGKATGSGKQRPSKANENTSQRNVRAPNNQSHSGPEQVASRTASPTLVKSAIQAADGVGVSPVEEREQRVNKAKKELDAAVEARDVNASLAAAKKLSGLTNADSLELEITVLETFTVAASPAQLNSVIREWLGLLEQAVAEGRTGIANRHKVPVLVLARKSGDAELLRRATLLVLKLQE
jgi:hypothetical protein